MVGTIWHNHWTQTSIGPGALTWDSCIVFFFAPSRLRYPNFDPFHFFKQLCYLGIQSHCDMMIIDEGWGAKKNTLIMALWLSEGDWILSRPVLPLGDPRDRSCMKAIRWSGSPACRWDAGTPFPTQGYMWNHGGGMFWQVSNVLYIYIY